VWNCDGQECRSAVSSPQEPFGCNEPARPIAWPGASSTVIPPFGRQTVLPALYVTSFFWGRYPMSSIIRLVLNLSINVKLGIASGLGVLLVGTMVITQMYANTAKRDLDAQMSEQQTIARDAVEVKASVAGMQVALRDLRLANSAADLKKAVDNLAARLKSANHYSDEMLKISKSGENRTRIEKLKARAGEYEKGAEQIAAVRSEALAATDDAQRLRS
jgi:hypothetical protein